MKTPTVGAAVVALALVSTAAYPHRAQTQPVQAAVGAASGRLQAPPARRATKPAIGRIKGRVITADTRSPVRRAHVRIVGPENSAKIVATDNDGRYEFRELPSGRYTITVFKSGYVSMEYGQKRPLEQGKWIDLIEAEPMDNADITLPRGAVISGRVVDEFGDPMRNAAVHAMRLTWVDGNRRLETVGIPSDTNDLGQYRLYGLKPGEYYISASLRVFDDVWSTFREMASQPGFSLSAAAQATGRKPSTGYPTTYYPGTPDSADAQRIALEPGVNKQNTDFRVLPVKLVTVTGTVVGSDGDPLRGAKVNAAPRSSGEMAFPHSLDGPRTDENGNFTLKSVAQGNYTLRAIGNPFRNSGAEDADVIEVRLREAGEIEFGSVPLTVGGEDVASIMIVTSKGTTAAGRVTWEGGAKPRSTAPLRVSAVPSDTDGPVAFGGSARVDAGGSFELKGLAGHMLFRVSGLPQGWVLKSVTLSGQDITDTGLDATPNQPVTGLEVVLSSRVTDVSGSVKAGNDQTTDYTVVIFAEDARKWTVPMTRYIAAARPNQHGRFQVTNLPPGNYYAVALDYIEQGDWHNAEVLDRLTAKAARFTLEEGKPSTLALTLSGG